MTRQTRCLSACSQDQPKASQASAVRYAAKRGQMRQGIMIALLAQSLYPRILNHR